MHMTPEFPDHRRQDPRRQREAEIYDDLAASAKPGQGAYELKVNRNAHELDFAIIMDDVGHLGLQVKGGHYIIDSAAWQRIKPDGSLEPVSCPLTNTWDAAMQMRQAIYDALNRKVFVVPVLLFPDMEPDPAIDA